MQTRRQVAYSALVIALLLSMLGLVPGQQPVSPAFAQTSHISARLRVDEPGVEVRRVNTVDWVRIRLETLVGPGDAIRTLRSGLTTVTFADSLLSLQLLPESQLTLVTFEGEQSKRFRLDVDAQRGLITFRGTRRTGDQIVYNVATPAFRAVVDGGDSDFRIEADGRSALISRTGKLVVTDTAGHTAQVGWNHGLRAPVGDLMSDVLPTDSFPLLDSQIDGCPGIVRFYGDLQINIRRGPNTNSERIGGLPSGSRVQAMGVTRISGWFLIRFQEGLGWLKISTLDVGQECPGLRVYPDNFDPGNVSAPIKTPTN